MKKLSLRWRLTLVTVAVLGLVCVFTSLYSIFNAKQMMGPVFSDIAGIRMTAQDITDTVSVITSGVPSQDNRISISSSTDPFRYYSNPLSGNRLQIDSYLFAPAGGDYFVSTMGAVQVAAQSAVIADQVETVSFTITAAQESFNYSSLIFMAAMILLGGVLVYFVSGYALKPVQKLSRDIKAIGGDQLSLRIDSAAGAEEIKTLAESFNGMLERLEQAFSAQKRFSTAAAHELKTPLATIRANVDVLKMSDEPTPEDYAELLDVLARQTGRMSRLVDDLFTMSSLQECDLDDDVPLDAALYSIAGELERSAAEKDIILEVDASECVVKGNQIMLSRAISNMVENGIRYTPGGGTVRIECGVSGNEAKIIVSDTGPGIPDEHLLLIFDPFYRVDPSRSRSLGGAGIGLAIAAQIAAQHGGRISAANREEGGCVFTFTLPVGGAH